MHGKIAKKLAPVTRFVNRGALKVKAHSPEILIAGGIVLGAVAIISAIKATPEAKEVMDARSSDIEELVELRENGKMSEETYKKSMFHIVKRTSSGLLKAYYPTILIFAGSSACVIGAHSISKKRYAALSAAFVAVDTSFKEYRKRVAAEFGEGKERELFEGKESEDIVIFTTDADGNEVTSVETDTSYSDAGYAKWWGKYKAPSGTDEPGNIMFKNSGVCNVATLKIAQEEANTLLQIRGHMFLNDVYEVLHMPKTKAGQILGWIYDREHPEDAFIDFGIFWEGNPDIENLEKGLADGIMLHFNPQGDIYSLMAEEA